MEPRHITEAKRAAARTGLVAGTVIFALLGVAIALLIVGRLSKGAPVGVSLWIGIVGMVVVLGMLIRSWKRNIEQRRTIDAPAPPSEQS